MVDESYIGSGTAVFTIDNVKAEIRSKDYEKTYGEPNPSFEITGLLDVDENNQEYVNLITDMFLLKSDADRLNEKASGCTDTQTTEVRIPHKAECRSVSSMIMKASQNMLFRRLPGALTTQ